MTREDDGACNWGWALAHPGQPCFTHSCFFFFSKNFLGQREKSQEPSVYQASFYQICVKGQRGKIMGAKLHKQHLYFVWSQKRQPPHLPPTQALPSPNSTLGKEGTAHLQGVSLGPWQGAPCAQGHGVITEAGVPRSIQQHTQSTLEGRHGTPHCPATGRPPHPEQFRERLGRFPHHRHAPAGLRGDSQPRTGGLCVMMRRTRGQRQLGGKGGPCVTQDEWTLAWGTLRPMSSRGGRTPRGAGTRGSAQLSSALLRQVLQK